jgi:hypothetical protein
VLVAFRGHSELIDVPDHPTAPINPGPPTILGTDGTIGAPAAGGSAPAILSAAASSPPDLSLTHADTTVVPVASVVTDIQAPAAMRGDGGGLSDAGGGGDGARDGDSLASLALNGSDYADHGWFIVPSTTNEYGDPGGGGQAFAAADDFSFDVAGGSFLSDWFWV